MHHGPETSVRAINEATRTIRGYGIVFNSDSEVLYERGKRFREVIRPEAMRNVDLSDVLSFHNHSPNRLLGRTKSGTMRVGTDNVGVWYEVDLPDSAIGHEVYESVRRGDTEGSSFQFRVAEGGEKWSAKDGIAYREVIGFEETREMGPVTEPAYSGTSEAGLSARSISMLLMINVCEEDAEDPETEDTPPLNTMDRAAQQRLLDDQDIEAMQMAIL